MVECPFCDGQGIVCKAQIEKLARTIYICDECDTIWLEGDQINEENCKRFDDFMKEHGLQPLWSELAGIGKYW